MEIIIIDGGLIKPELIIEKESKKDTQLEINFDETEKEKEEQPKKLNVDKYKKLTKDELIKILIETEQKFEEFEKIADEKYSDLFGKYNQLLVKENKQYHAIQNLKCTVNMLEESNSKLVNDYNFLQRLYNGIIKTCAKWKNEAINYQYKLRKYQLFDDLL